jgi:hypothetical protein
MSQFGLLSDLRKLSPSSPLTEQLGTERGLRFFLLHVYDRDADCPELMDALASTYTDYLTQFPKFARRSQATREFAHVLKTLKGADEPSHAAICFLEHFPAGFDALKHEFSQPATSASLARSLAHTFGSAAYLSDETFLLQKRTQLLQASRSVVTSPLRKVRPAGARSVVFSPTRSPERSKPEATLRAAVQQRRREVTGLQGEVDRLKAEAHALRQARPAETDYRQTILTRRKQADELTRQLEVAVAENRRLKQMCAE